LKPQSANQYRRLVQRARRDLKDDIKNEDAFKAWVAHFAPSSQSLRWSARVRYLEFLADDLPIHDGDPSLARYTRRVDAGRVDRAHLDAFAQYLSARKHALLSIPRYVNILTTTLRRFGTLDASEALIQYVVTRSASWVATFSAAWAEYIGWCLETQPRICYWTDPWTPDQWAGFAAIVGQLSPTMASKQTLKALRDYAGAIDILDASGVIHGSAIREARYNATLAYRKWALGAATDPAKVALVPLVPGVEHALPLSVIRRLATYAREHVDLGAYDYAARSQRRQYQSSDSGSGSRQPSAPFASPPSVSAAPVPVGDAGEAGDSQPVTFDWSDWEPADRADAFRRGDVMPEAAEDDWLSAALKEAPR
jgi:hypothetical protein